MKFNRISILLNKKYPKAKFKFNTSKSGTESIIWLSDDHPSDEEVSELIATPIASDGDENWDRLLSLLLETEIFNKAYAAGKRTITANAAFTIFMNALMIRDVDTLRFAFDEVMKIKPRPMFEPEDLEQLRQILINANFVPDMIMGELLNG